MRRFLVGTSATLIITIFHWMAAHGLTWLDAVPTWSIATSYIVLQVLWWLLQYANNLRKAGEPNIAISFCDDAPYRYEQEVKGRKLCCYRFRLKNLSRSFVKNCKAQLEGAVDYEGRESVHIPFPLRRSGSGSQTFNLRADEEKFIDLLAITEDAKLPIKVAKHGESWPTFDGSGSGLPLKSHILKILVLSDGPPVRMQLRLENIGNAWRLKPIVPNLSALAT
jgi:hypothetical protein